MRSALLAVLVTAVFATSAHAAEPVVTVGACGDVVPAKSRGVLAADLDCTGFDGNAVNVEPGATLDLGGFTLTGGQFGVACDTGTCQIVNGTVTGAQFSGILGDRPTIRNLTVTGNGVEGVQGYQKARAYDSTITNNGGLGIKGWAVLIERSTVTGNGESGVSASRHNDSGGGFSRGVKAKDSTVTGNGTNPACNTSDGVPCADISSGTRPKLKRTTCDTTHAPFQVRGCAYPHWCVCAIN